MSKRAKQKRVSPYRQRAINPTGGLSIITNKFDQAFDLLQLEDEQITNLGITNWSSFGKILSGISPTIDDWAIITNSMNMALLLAEGGYGIEHQDQFNRALEGMTRMYVRGKRTGLWRFDGLAINEVRAALELHDQQCKLVSHVDIRRAMLGVLDRINSGHVYHIEEVAA